MSESPDQEEQIFSEALDRPAHERAAFLDTACRGNPALRQAVDALLAAHDDAGGFMEEMQLEIPPAATVAAATEAPGMRIGRYKLLQKLGEGGCGVVWMAEQEIPVRRRVALKVIKLGMDTKSVIARFEAERQALAMMDHPNIAKVFDAGSTDKGRPYFVMELVRGVPITKYCDETSLATKPRLELFTQVCLAVQHAHQKGIIHRDLKPSNVLVTLHDGVPVPKVIDFGIAKATQGPLTDQTLFTAFEQFMGTPAYMSPEQAEMSGLDIDTRSDIYSLGVMLYELLTGRQPFDPASLMQVGLDEIRRVIREVEPPKPSTNLSTLNGTDRLAVARLRGTDPARLSVMLRGDLDWIVMKAMEKNRTRRYDSPTDLAADILRHLHDEPVVARPPSRAYQLSKLIRRHRFAVTAASAVVIALIVGTIVSTWQAIRATRAEKVASEERSNAVAERARAEDLLSFMVGDLRTELAKVGRLEVLEGVGAKAMTYFSSRDPKDLDDTTLARYAKALRQIGELRIDQARYAEALASFAEAYTRAQALVQRHPKDDEILFERGQAEYWNGFVHWKRDEFPAAGEWLTRYRDTCQALVALDPAQPKWQTELSYSQHNLAVLRTEQGQLDAAREAFLGELTTLNQILSSKPEELEPHFVAAEAHSWLGGLAERQGNFADAATHYTAQIAQLDRLVQAEPRNTRWQFNRVKAQLLQVEIFFATGKYPAAGELLKKAVSQLDDLVAHDPTNRSWQAAALNSRLKTVRQLRQEGNNAGAVRLLDEVRPALEALLATEPSDRKFAFWLADAWRWEAQLRSAAGRTDTAIAAARAVDQGAVLVREGRATDSELGEFATACIVAGKIAAEAGDGDEARRQWLRAADILAPHLSGTRDWRLLDPAARAAAWLARSDEARALIARLVSLGYVPPDPWPDLDRPGADKNSVNPVQSK